MIFAIYWSDVEFENRGAKTTYNILHKNAIEQKIVDKHNNEYVRKTKAQQVGPTVRSTLKATSLSVIHKMCQVAPTMHNNKTTLLASDASEIPLDAYPHVSGSS